MISLSEFKILYMWCLRWSGTHVTGKMSVLPSDPQPSHARELWLLSIIIHLSQYDCFLKIKKTKTNSFLTAENNPMFKGCFGDSFKGAFFCAVHVVIFKVLPRKTLVCPQVFFCVSCSTPSLSFHY